MSILFNENPLTVNTELARKIGLNESIVLQQIHYWIKINEKAKRNYKGGYYWTYNTFEEWQEQFPFWSLSTIKRIFAKLEKAGLIITGNYNKLKTDRTKWYRINYQALETLENSPKCQNELMDVSNWSNGSGQNEPTITRDYPETTSETNKYLRLLNGDDIFLDFYLDEHRRKLKREHVRVTEDQLFDIEAQIKVLKKYGVSLERWKKEVREHFRKLPKSNNGNILAFLRASARYFEIDLQTTT